MTGGKRNPPGASSIQAQLFAGPDVVPSSKAEFADIYERFKGPIMSYVFQMTQNAGLSEDLTHEVFLRAWRTRDTFRGQSKYSTWLWTIARNSTIDHFRKNSTKLETNDSIDVESPATSAESALIEQCDRLAVEGCMQKLTTDQREALSLRTLADLSYDEIAVAMQTSLPAVKSLINRAKRSLIECLRTNDRGAP